MDSSNWKDARSILLPSTNSEKVKFNVPVFISSSKSASEGGAVSKIKVETGMDALADMPKKGLPAISLMAVGRTERKVCPVESASPVKSFRELTSLAVRLTVTK